MTECPVSKRKFKCGPTKGVAVAKNIYWISWCADLTQVERVWLKEYAEIDEANWVFFFKKDDFDRLFQE